MVTLGIQATMVAQAGQEEALAEFLINAHELAQAETGTITWYAFRLNHNTFGIFDSFESEEARQDHINGKIPAALSAHADQLLAEAPVIVPVDILAFKK